MNNIGLTPNGFKKKTYSEIIEAMETRARELYGEDVNLSESSPLGIFFKTIAWELKDSWQVVEDVYYSSYIDTAEGLALDNAAKYISISRKPKQKASGYLLIKGTSGTIVPANFRVSDISGKKIYETQNEVTIGSNGEVSVVIEAIIEGVEQNTQKDTVTRLATPIAGVRSVNNPDPIVGGKDIETDRELRERYFNSLSNGGSATVNAIRAKILSIPKTRAAKVIENPTDFIDSEGRPPHSIQCYVLDGNRHDIANVIFDTKSAGILTVGSEREIVQDSSGDLQEVFFDYAVEVPVYLNIKVFKNDLYNSESEEEIKQALIQYIGGIDDEGVPHAGLSMGDRLVHARLVRSIIDIIGVDDIEIETSIDNINFSAASIAVKMNEVAQISYENMVITYA